MKTVKHSMLAIAIAIVTATPAIAFEKGDILIRAGYTNVSPDDSSSNVNVGGTDLGIGVSVDSGAALGLNFVYFFNSSWAVELLAATPFEHDIDLNTVGELAQTDHLPPTLSANYYFNDVNSQFQPYVGIGLNYTIFFDEEFTGANRDAGFSDLSLDESFGLSAQLGFDYEVNPNWYLNASVRWIDIDTDATFDLNGSRGVVDVEIDPYVYSLTLGYKF